MLETSPLALSRALPRTLLLDFSFFCLAAADFGLRKRERERERDCHNLSVTDCYKLLYTAVVVTKTPQVQSRKGRLCAVQTVRHRHAGTMKHGRCDSLATSAGGQGREREPQELGQGPGGGIGRGPMAGWPVDFRAPKHPDRSGEWGF